MKQASVLLQIALFIGGSTALVMYVYPEFTTVNENQNLTQEYQEAIAEAETLRDDIDRLQNQVSSIPDSDMEALERYLPTESIDMISVQRDLFLYTQSRNLLLNDLSAEDSSDRREESEIETADFRLVVTGDYSGIQAFIADLERNDYPLRVQGLEMSPNDLGLIQADFTIQAYRFVHLEDNLE